MEAPKEFITPKGRRARLSGVHAIRTTYPPIWIAVIRYLDGDKELRSFEYNKISKYYET